MRTTVTTASGSRVVPEPRGGSRVVQRIQRAGMRRLVQQTVDGELAKLPAHVAQLTAATGEQAAE